jgi:hypothetical protein
MATAPQPSPPPSPSPIAFPSPAPPQTTEAFYATTPTRATIFWRTFLPWQLWRFVVINLKMIRIIWLGHHQRRAR